MGTTMLFAGSMVVAAQKITEEGEPTRQNILKYPKKVQRLHQRLANSRIDG